MAENRRTRTNIQYDVDHRLIREMVSGRPPKKTLTGILREDCFFGISLIAIGWFCMAITQKLTEQASANLSSWLLSVGSIGAFWLITAFGAAHLAVLLISSVGHPRLDRNYLRMNLVNTVVLATCMTAYVSIDVASDAAVSAMLGACVVLISMSAAYSAAESVRVRHRASAEVAD